MQPAGARPKNSGRSNLGTLRLPLVFALILAACGERGVPPSAGAPSAANKKGATSAPFDSATAPRQCCA